MTQGDVDADAGVRDVLGCPPRYSAAVRSGLLRSVRVRPSGPVRPPPE
ncbi:hypothetical protein KPATCC21470_4762 [Kitasatospora purpeofusca]